MDLENQEIRYFDVVSGKTSTELDQLAVVEKGYDSFFIEVPQPKTLVNPAAKGIARYASALPLANIPIYLGEGNTPLIPSKKYPNLYIKNEGVNPSGNFKDRESALALAYAKAQGYKKLAIVSSGNAALSAALYAQLYGFEIECIVPENTSKQKTRLIELFGGKAKLLGATYEESFHYLLDNIDSSTINITSGVFPIRSDGSKTIAYEIWEELGGVPDTVVCPAGNGSLLSAIFQGFKELRDWKLADKLPRLLCVQIEHADPINRAVLQNTWYEVLGDVPPSPSEAIVAEESFCSPKAVFAIRESNGQGLSVSDDDVTRGLRYAVGTEGVIPEISSASVFGALLRFEDEIIQEGQTTVIINTATGLKDLNNIEDLLGHA